MPRHKGVPNKTTADVRQAILWASGKLGGPKRLAQWAAEDPENERLFWTRIYPKLLPKEIKAEIGVDESLAARLDRAIERVHQREAAGDPPWR